MDFGLTPAVVFGQTIRGRVFVLGELYAEGVGAVSFAPVVKREILRRFGGLDLARVKFIGDPGSAVRSQTDEQTPFDIFRQQGMPVRPAPGANRFSKVGGRKEVVDSLLERQVDGYQALMIDPGCRMLVQGLSGVRGPATAAQLLYEETPESILARQKAAEMHRLAREPALSIEQGRPTKRDRRLIQRAWDDRWGAGID